MVGAAKSRLLLIKHTGLFVFTCCVLLASACGRMATGGAVSSPFDVQTDERCTAATGTAKPFVAGWTPLESLWLKKKASEELVLVKYTPCGIEVLAGCGVEGSYDNKERVRASSTEHILSKDDIVYKLPLGASDLVDEFEPGDRWALRYALSGVTETSIAAVGRDRLAEGCTEATHFVQAMVTGAYELTRDTFGAGEDDDETHDSIRQEGEIDHCSQKSDSPVDPLCSAVVQLYLQPLSGGAEAEAQLAAADAPTTAGAKADGGPVEPVELLANPFLGVSIDPPKKKKKQKKAKKQAKPQSDSTTIAVNQLMMKDADADLGGPLMSAKDVSFKKQWKKKGQASGKGSLDDESEVIHLLARWRSKIKSCYEMGLLADPTLEGKVTVRFKVARSGKVTKARVLSSELPAVVGKCIVHKIKKLAFPPQEEPSSTYEYPFIFGL
jgi:TonB family protein